MREYTGIGRPTKDLDIFVRPSHCFPVLECLAGEGFATELTDRDWLAKVFWEEDFIDIIWSSGNAVATVDDAWFEHAVPTQLFGFDVQLVPPEEMIWSKAYVMERDRFDGADIVHLILKCGERLDYGRLLARMDADWELLLVHLVLFRFVYPGERRQVPEWLLAELERRLHAEHSRGDVQLSRGPLLSRKGYVVDLEKWGYKGPPRAVIDIAPGPPKVR
jgi:hypothetical protein